MTSFQPMAGLSRWDVSLLLVYLAASALIGAAFYRQRTTEEYFLAGRSMGFFPVGISILATLFSAISYLGVPAFAYEKNISYLVYGFTIPAVVPLLLWIFLPFYHRLKLVSAYEYLGLRFDGQVRTLASLLFLLLRACYLAVATYAPALVLSLVTGFPLGISILLIGGLTTLYTVLGGMKAVIWTDVLQFCVFYGAIFGVAIAIVAGIEGGLPALLRIASEKGKLRLFDFDFSLYNDQSLWGMVIGGLFINLASYGVDQFVLQRYLTARTLREGKLSLVCNGLLVIPSLVMLYLTGVGLFVFYHLNPELLRPLPTNDSILPYFVIHQLPPGVPGLFVAGLFAAAMSTFSGGVNSLTTILYVDFWPRQGGRGEGGAPRVRVARLFTAGWGVLITVGALFVGRLGGLFDAALKVNGFFGGVLLGTFLLGMLTRRANASGALTGMVVGMGAVIAVAFSTKISFFWYSPIGCLATFAMGWTTSLLGPSPATREDLVLCLEDAQRAGRSNGR